MTVKLTFNKPATEAFLRGGSVTRIALRVEGGRMVLEESDAPSAAMTVRRRRGGAMAMVPCGRSLERHLRRATGPFFSLAWDDGTCVARPYRGRGAPPRNLPHLRVWSCDAPEKEDSTVPSEIRDMYRGARAVVEAHAQGLEIPVAEVAAARRLLSDLRALARDVGA